MSKKTLQDTLVIRSTVLKNRICAGPMGNSTITGSDGIVSDAMVEHFRAVAQGGAALIVQGSVSVTEVNRAHLTQTGIWSDKHIEGLSRISKAVHSEGSKIILQIEHAGIRDMVDKPFSPSPFVLDVKGSKKVCRVMTLTDIYNAQEAYVEAGRRAVEAGYDGVELHASHGWLINAFLSPCINLRTDEYGEDSMLFVREIFDEIRRNAPDDFIIGVRHGGFNPNLKIGLEQGKQLEEMGFDYISISNNPGIKWLPQELTMPEGYPFSVHEYSAGEMKKVVNIPVLGGKGLRTLKEVNAVLAETDIDMVTLGRPILADPTWPKKAIIGKEPNLCHHCPGRCKWELGGENCAAVAVSK